MSGFLGGGIGPVALKRRRAAADWWQVAGQTCVAAYQPIGAATLAASYVNLANPGTYDAAPGVAPTLAAGGWSFGGAQWLTTGITPINNQQWTMIIRFSDVVMGNYQSIAGTYSPPIEFAILPGTVGDNRCYYANGGISNASPRATAGILAISGSAAYRNGIFDVNIPSSDGHFTIPISIGITSGRSTFFVGTITAVAIYSTTLSAADVAELTTRMQALA